MLIGAHVSTAGGLTKAVERGTELGCDAIQIFNQSPRMWRPTAYTDGDFAEFRDAIGGSALAAVTIHAVYLINGASREREIRAKSIASLTHALRVGDGIGAEGVVLHAGARKGEPLAASMKRAAKAIAAALAESEVCAVLLENTAGTQGPLGRDFDELARLLELLDRDRRVGICLDSCHLLASGYEIRTPEALDLVLAEFDAKVGLERLRCLHLNDSQIPLGGNRDRHANLGAGEIGERGLAVFLSEPRFEELPVLIETGGEDGAPVAEDIEHARRLREQGLAARRKTP
ncbi:MAG: apurinic endonuclease Apn1 [Solirubrobacterales bacterium]|nr:apurinic endonuclease Apn1 [Solirubrobacterales bacterium]